MKRMPMYQLVPGMVLARDILSMNHHMILASGTELTDKMIVQLDMYGILDVYIADQVSPPADQPAAEQSYSERVRNSEEFHKFKEQYEENVESFKNDLNTLVKRNVELDVSVLLKNALNLVSDNKGKVSVIDMLQNMREYDGSTFSHCLNVGLLCNVIAGWLKMNEEETELVTACGMLHDIGKLLISHTIIAKPGKLLPWEFLEVKKHPELGYQLLRSHNADERICNAVLMHHERCDGGGYPSGLQRDQIDMYAKIVAIADVYDAMTASRVYRGALCPFQVIETFEAEGIQKYDVVFIMTFLENVANTYIKNRCKLSDGRTGDIIFINRNHLSRPIVQCGTQYVDLSKVKGIQVECLL